MWLSARPPKISSDDPCAELCTWKGWSWPSSPLFLIAILMRLPLSASACVLPEPEIRKEIQTLGLLTLQHWSRHERIPSHRLSKRRVLRHDNTCNSLKIPLLNYCDTTGRGPYRPLSHRIDLSDKPNGSACSFRKLFRTIVRSLGYATAHRGWLQRPNHRSTKLDESR